MANHLAIATATEALRLRIHSAVRTEFQGAQVLAKRPESNDGQAQSQVSVFLYRVSPNAALRNADLPTRDAEGRAVRRPVTALDLHYILSFTGDEQQLAPQRMLGLAVSALHAEPVLTRSVLEQAAQGQTWLAGSDLSEQVESVKFGPSPLTLDDLTKLWSVFVQIPYQLSAVYEASVVLIEADAAVRRTIPVEQPGVDALPIRRPVIEGLTGDRPVAGAVAPTLELTGRHLRGPATFVVLDGGPGVPVTPESNTRLVVPTVASAVLGAGVHGVQVFHEMPLGPGRTPHRAVESDVFPFVLRPAITARAVGTEVEIDFTPPVRPGQRVRLLLDELVEPAPADRLLRSLTLDPVDENTEGPWTTRRFDIRGVEAGTYLARVQVDGAESNITADESGRPTPRVTIQ